MFLAGCGGKIRGEGTGSRRRGRLATLSCSGVIGALELFDISGVVTVYILGYPYMPFHGDIVGPNDVSGDATLLQVYLRHAD